MRRRNFAPMRDLATLFKLLGMPLVAGLLLIAFGVQGVDLGIRILLTGTPTATATYIMPHQMKADGELAGSIVMLSTLTSAVSYTLLLLLLRQRPYPRNQYPPWSRPRSKRFHRPPETTTTQ